MRAHRTADGLDELPSIPVRRRSGQLLRDTAGVNAGSGKATLYDYTGQDRVAR